MCFRAEAFESEADSAVVSEALPVGELPAELYSAFAVMNLTKNGALSAVSMRFYLSQSR